MECLCGFSGYPLGGPEAWAHRPYQCESPSAMEIGGLGCLESMPGARSQGGGLRQGEAGEGTVVLLISGDGPDFPLFCY